MNNKYDPIVIGSGCGITAAASLLSSLGHDTLLPKSHSFGRRVSTCGKNGCEISPKPKTDKTVVENGMAKGARSNGDSTFAENTIRAIDINKRINRMVGYKYFDNKYKRKRWLWH